MLLTNVVRGGLANAAPPASFRELIPDVLTQEEARRLQWVGTQSFSHPLVARCVEWMRTIAPDASIEAPAYCRVEKKADGHDWHQDTGDGDHMPWCRYSGSVLLSPPDMFSGGWFEFDAPAERHKHYLGLLVYTSDNWHRVTPHDGDRRALIIFLG